MMIYQILKFSRQPDRRVMILEAAILFLTIVRFVSGQSLGKLFFCKK